MILGLYGGVGSGKSLILNYLKESYGAVVIGMDETAHALYCPGQAGYEAVLKLLGTEVLNEDGTLDRKKMGNILYRNEALLKQLDAVIHPLVYRTVELEAVKADSEGKKTGREPLVVVETALPDPGSVYFSECWFVYTPREIRTQRLMESRGYSAERVAEIMAKQPSEDDYRALCKEELYNGDSTEALQQKIDILLSGKVRKLS